MIKNQTVTRENWKEVQERCRVLEEEKQEQERMIQEAIQELASLRKSHEERQILIAKVGIEMQHQKQAREGYWKKRKQSEYTI